MRPRWARGRNAKSVRENAQIKGESDMKIECNSCHTEDAIQWCFRCNADLCAPCGLRHKACNAETP